MKMKWQLFLTTKMERKKCHRSALQEFFKEVLQKEDKWCPIKTQAYRKQWSLRNSTNVGKYRSPFSEHTPVIPVTPQAEIGSQAQYKPRQS
jgi:hypothetical protein